MIYIQDKHKCCGCAACVQACPKHCISFNEDEQGFRYPLVDKSHCIDCGLCDKVCPVINQSEAKKTLKVYAAQNPNDEIRLNSSSGGIFSMLAEAIIDEGGVVFGACFDKNWEVEHAYTETKEGLVAFRGSKYLQSRTENTYREARDFLNAGRKVLFSGTSCQIAGLKKFLRKEYENLLTVEILCHSAPSPLVWRKFLEEKIGDSKIDYINFRNKSTGWSNYSYSLVIMIAEKNIIIPSDHNYFNGMISNLTTRPSCSCCPAKNGKSDSDILLGDCWGIWDYMPSFDDNKGVSLVKIFSSKGDEFFNKIKSTFIEIDENFVRKYNGGLLDSKKMHKNHDTFFHSLNQISLSEALDLYISNRKISIGFLRKMLNIILKK